MTLPSSLPTFLRPGTHRFALESRQLFDGAAFAEAVSSPAPSTDAFADSQDGQPERSIVEPFAEPFAEPAPASPEPSAARNVFVVDQGITGWQSLVAALPQGSDIILLAADGNGVAQLAEALAGRAPGIDALHILSHGAQDRITLGGQTLGPAEIARDHVHWQAIGAALAADGDLLLYGCEVAADGSSALIDSLATLTAADVAASSDPTGAAARGGNWALEVATGPIAATALLAADALTGYEALLGDPQVADASIATATPGDNEALIGTTVDLQLTFDNSDPGGLVGYGPFVDVYLSRKGHDGNGAEQDGIRFSSASYLGAGVQAET